MSALARNASIDCHIGAEQIRANPGHLAQYTPTPCLQTSHGATSKHQSTNLHSQDLVLHIEPRIQEQMISY